MFRASKVRPVLVGAAATAAVAAPVAVASASGIQGGQRNPGTNPSISYHRETQIISDVGQGQGGTAAGTGGFATRQSNKSNSGGGAIYGCRARTGTNPCVEAVNLFTGHAFEFVAGSGADAVGKIWFGPDFTKPVPKPPFVTNASGLVQNLNADMVGGRHVNELVTTDQLLFAVVDGAGHLGSDRGATAAAIGAPGSPSNSTGATGPSGANVQTYTVTFADDVSKCAYTATPTSVSAGSVAAASGPAATGGAVHQVVVSESGSPTGFSLQVSC